MTALATVHPIRTAEPRELRARLFTTEPNRSMAVDHLMWSIEQTLVRAFEDGNPADHILTVFAPTVADRARPALADVFDAADELADYLEGVLPGPEYVWQDRLLDAEMDLANLLRGVEVTA